MTQARETELLSPAGDWDCLRAAVANGADAVYFGLGAFNARHRATNFGVEELPAIFEYLRAHRVRGYVTFNTLVFSDELTQAARLIEAIATVQADALIVQDLGIVRLARQVAPGLAVHASTQTTLTEPDGLAMVSQLGVERVILARELSIEEIAQIVEQVSLPVEVFVHGALCVAYSGQCLTSEALGGRSANRGQCAQACRLPYELVVDGQTRDLGDKAYLLSPQDLAAYDLVDRLVGLGICSLKIEGRLKSAEYVAVATRTYRRALDAALARQPYAIRREERTDLELSFSRGFAPGFLAGVDHQRLVAGRFPKSRGVCLGRVAGLTSSGVLLELASEQHAALAEELRLGVGAEEALKRLVKPGDGLVFDQGHPEQDEQGGRVYEVAWRDAPPMARRVAKARSMAGVARRGGGGPRGLARRDEDSGGTTREDESGDGAGGRQGLVELRFGRGRVQTRGIAVGSLVWKTDDPTLRRRLGRDFGHDAPRRVVPLDVHIAGDAGGALVIRFQPRGEAVVQVTWEGPLEAARKHPLDEALVRQQLGRLGETPFELGSVLLELPTPVMVPKSVLNELRRQAVAELDRRARIAVAGPVDSGALDRLRGEVAAGGAAIAAGDGPTADWSVLVRTVEQLAAVGAWQPEDGLPRPGWVYCDFEDPRRYAEAVVVARAAGLRVALATLRVVKPNDGGLLRQILRAEPDAVLVRNLGGLDFFRQQAPALCLIGDYSLNVANELTADLCRGWGLSRITPSYDLNWEQLAALLRRFDAGRCEVVIHQHMPMFHMEHCVFAATLSRGKDHRDCGRPCDRHQVSLRDRTGADLPLLADVGCRNTVFNAVAQSAAEYVARMQTLGVGRFRVELLRETATECRELLEHYARLLAGREAGRQTWQRLQVLDQLGVTRGTLGE